MMLFKRAIIGLAFVGMAFASFSRADDYHPGGGSSAAAPNVVTDSSGANFKSIVDAVTGATLALPLATTPAVTGPFTASSLAESVTPVDELAISGTCSASCNGALITADMASYNSLSYAITTGASGAVVTYQTCDQASLAACTTWVTNHCVLLGNPPQLSAGSNSTLLGSFSCQKRGEFIRLNISGYTSGTITISGHLHAYAVENIVFTAPLPYTQTHITTDATTTIKTSLGLLHEICFNSPTATETVTIYDNSTATGTVVGIWTTPASPSPTCLTMDALLNVGLTVVTAVAAGDITILSR